MPFEKRESSSCLESGISGETETGAQTDIRRKGPQGFWHRESSLGLGKGHVKTFHSNTKKLFEFEVTVYAHVLGGKQIFVISFLESQQHSSLYKATHLYILHIAFFCFPQLNLVSPVGLPVL